MFCKFTKKYFNYFYERKYNLSDNNSLLLFINKEKEKILNFIKNTKIEISYIQETNNIDEVIIKEILNSKFVDYENVILKNKLFNKTLIIKWKNNKIIIRCQNKNIKLLILKIKFLIYFIEYFKNVKKLEIYLFLVDLEKFTPTEDEIINAEHINSGYSQSNNFDSLIVIWRLEEFEKVLLHEIIHAFDLDKRHDHTPEIIDSSIHNYFEALTDFYAVIYKIIYLSIITNINEKLFLEIELKFIENQAMKINSILKLGDWVEKPIIYVNQKSSAFSYYIIKYLLFDYFINIEKNIDVLKYLSENNFNSILTKLFQKKKKFIISDYNNLNSLRMTLFQLRS